MKFSIERREMNVPSHAVKVEDKETKAVVYVYSDSMGRPCARAFKPRAVNPTWRFFFHNEEQRQARASQFFTDVREWKERVKAKRGGDGGRHTLKVGDILNSSWGYDQTNIDFYEVINLVGKTMVEIREIRGTRTYLEHGHGTCVPIPGDFIDAPLRKKVSALDNSIRISSYEYASPWSGEPKYFSNDR